MYELPCEPASHLTSHFNLRPGRIFVRGASLSIFASSTCQHTILQKKSIGKEKKIEQQTGRNTTM